MPSTFTIHNVASYTGASFPGDVSTSSFINFNLPLPPSLETSRIQLVPFLPSIHAEPFFSAYTASPSLDKYLPISLSTYPALLSLVQDDILKDKASVLFAIIDKTKGPNADLTESLAGIIGLLHSSTKNRTIEIGPVIILPGFQGTFVSPNAVGALLKYLLDTPAQGGLGLRRVQWTANPENQASVRAAQRMGFKLEGIMRWSWCLPQGKEGREVGEGGRGYEKGRDSAVLAVCWDDWENGGREHAEKLIDRP
ncbi:hypothetical protein J132_07438 [Termitomyces sp. J132]|nr:hypothetical protein C0989_002684 [Termitomyces sp. Mn162]KAH0581648.1 hypothetical protein H2248_011345 [Termitomyces sp. 'cryptogamus']KNZ74276.1 hypothetical protein J132_07438 [Termitomyces sp. J132]